VRFVVAILLDLEVVRYLMNFFLLYFKVLLIYFEVSMKLILEVFILPCCRRVFGNTSLK
jgi:hypothetical protein